MQFSGRVNLALFSICCFLIFAAERGIAANSTYNTWICDCDKSAEFQHIAKEAILEQCNGLFLILYPETKQVVIGGGEYSGEQINSHYTQTETGMDLEKYGIVLEPLDNSCLLYYKKGLREDGLLFYRH